MGVISLSFFTLNSKAPLYRVVSLKIISFDGFLDIPREISSVFKILFEFVDFLPLLSVAICESDCFLSCMFFKTNVFLMASDMLFLIRPCLYTIDIFLLLEVWYGCSSSGLWQLEIQLFIISILDSILASSITLFISFSAFCWARSVALWDW